MNPHNIVFRHKTEKPKERIKKENIVLGSWLKDQRSNVNMTQKIVSESIGIHKNSLQKYENGYDAIPATTFLKLVKLYDADLTELV